MSIERFLNNDLIKLNLLCKDRDHFFEFMFNEAFDKGLVDKQFLSKIKERESIFPTGLKLNEFSVAIPHTDPQYVKEQFIAVVTLEKPIKFSLMDDASQETDVCLVFMLGLNQPHQQIEILKQLMAIIQNPSNIKNLLSAESCEEVRNIFKQMEAKA
ncbi:PTS sugar transporter subunit IIA [Neobacillus thermocopriae]|uniref:PTS sugar transporter subunit IIA n=1 Tax=Neobacillus thermocopriae TaxID=1215031 RepID=A0A6B3TNT1_9BACI|nr:PTS sugar transporter subunit IIA [Neobacillus thermocopriae]MED3624750.1 PTS sugar transporter subunit IIA [Neobacillus thermocopriae]MED3713100.1 PTS sugar transporter subunit IIA [Neobacillus thermocopriae]NEX78523.1 PTS sugar transporter subunit IIA [Neobacillus thermocopriae]